MKIALLQRDIVWADPDSNRQRNEDVIAGYGSADLLVFPEMFSTGFCTVPDGIAEKSPSGTLSWMKEKAAGCGCAVAGSIAVEEYGRFYNRFYFVHPDSRVEYYDKRHLFTYGGEDRHFTPGNKRTVVEHSGVRILLQVCYDLRFPVWSRNLGDYDMAVYVASWPESRIEAWKSLLRARAIENQCYVAGVNRCGDDPSNHYTGATMLVDPYGNVVAGCPDGTESGIIADVDMELLRDFRRKFPVLDDADKGIERIIG